MKKNILALAALVLTLVSCGNASGGNKGIVPEDNAVPVHNHEQHAEH